MTGLIKFASQVKLSEQLQGDPFTYLFLAHLPPNLPLSGKTRYLKEFVLALINLEQHAENTSTRNHWLSIAGGFSAAITIAGSTALAPFGGMILSGSALVAAAATIIETLVTKSQTEAITKTLKLHRLALESQQSQQWAALWEYAQSDLFLAALTYASDGFVVGEKLIQRGDDSPFMRAVDFVAQCKGLEYIQVIEDARNLLSKPTGEIKKLVLQPMMPQQQATPTAIEPPKPQSQSPIPKTKEELLQALRCSCPALLSLVKSHPIRCVGAQRSGKTTLVKKLALLRLVLLHTMNQQTLTLVSSRS
jgi:hypothetical protein